MQNSENKLPNPSENQKLPIKLGQHPFLDELTQILSEPVNWEILQQGLYETGVMNQLHNLHINRTAPGSVLEFYVAQAIYRLALEHPDYIALNPIQPGEAGRYTFSYGPGYRTTVFDNESQTTYGDIDDIFRIITGETSLLVAVETKIVPAKKATNSTSAFRRTLQANYIQEKILDPLQAYTKTHPLPKVDAYGFIVVTTRDAIRSQSQVQKAFQEELGGHLVGIPVESQTFRKNVEKILPRASRRSKREEQL